MAYTSLTPMKGPFENDNSQRLLWKIATYLAGVISGSVGFLVRGSLTPSIPTSSTGLSWERRQNLDETPRAIKASAGKIFGLTLINPNTAKAFVKFCNVAAGSVTVGTTAVQHTVEVPANDGTNDGQVIITPSAFPQFEFATAISYYAVNELADSGTTGPTSDLHSEIAYA